MEPIEFRPWAKIGRLNRPITVTEKIDGTNGAIGIINLTNGNRSPVHDPRICEASFAVGIYAQSRSRIITPDTDNHGFARWVWDHGARLVEDLGPGLHYGEWWGYGINRGYGLAKGDQRFSLFNTERWADRDEAGVFTTPGLYVVPVLRELPTFNTLEVLLEMDRLREFGSVAVPGFKRPEGVVIYHKATRTLLKATLERDDEPKSAAELLATRSSAKTGA